MWGIWSRWFIPALIFCEFETLYPEEAGVFIKQCKLGDCLLSLVGSPMSVPWGGWMQSLTESNFYQGAKPLWGCQKTHLSHCGQYFCWLYWISSSETLWPPMLNPTDDSFVPPLLEWVPIHSTLHDIPVPRNVGKVVSWGGKWVVNSPETDTQSNWVWHRVNFMKESNLHAVLGKTWFCIHGCMHSQLLISGWHFHYEFAYHLSCLS